ncbi:MAG: hypothetical protein K0B81_05130 [Candidatus Cloacimonetes bacterium]|nr:hypothetical protein [Candidatus Cloacimonadota bacterium]
MTQRKIVLLILAFLLSFYVTFILGILSNGDLQELYEENFAYKSNLYESMQLFIERNPDFYRLDDLYFKLAELSAELFISEPDLVLNNFRKVLEFNPEYPLRDIVLYNIGYYSADYVKKQRDQRRYDYIQRMISDRATEPIIRWGDEFRLTEDALAESISAYREILTDFPESRYYSETLYRLSVLYYEIGLDAEEPIIYYQKAKDLLDFIAGHEGDDYQYLGLYQRGWAYFSTNRYANAIEDFSKILNLVKDERLLRAYFEEDALENIAYSLERMDEGDYLSTSRSVVFAKDNLPEMLESEQHIKRIIQRAISLKLDLNAPFQAVDYYEAYLTMFPLSIDNPTIVDTTATIYRVYAFMLSDEEKVRDLVVAQKEKMIEHFHAKSEWYQYNSQYDISKQLEIIKEAYEFMEPRYYNRFVNDKSDDNFNAYSDLVTKYSEFPEFMDTDGLVWVRTKSKNKVDFIIEIAQVREQPYYYLKAHEMISDFNEKYPDNNNHLDYEFRKFLAIETLFDQIYTDLKDQPYRDETHDLIITESELKNLFIQNTNQFLSLFSESEFSEYYTEDIVRALYKRSLVYIEDEQFTEAERDLLLILDFDVSNDLRRAVYIYLAQINEKLDNYTLSERYYRNAADYSIDETDRENIKNHYRSQMQAKANLLVIDNAYLEAAAEYLRLAYEYRETDIERYVGFTREAIDAYIKAHDYERAVQHLTALSIYRSRPEEAYLLYSRAWNIADTLMYDQQLTKDLKNEYIAKYPSSYEAYNTRYSIIEDYARNPATKYLASELLLELHEDAEAGRIDYGEDSTANIYYDALELYHDHYDNEFLVSVMLGFTDRYPNDPRTLDILELVALKYADMGRNDEFERLARHIYQRNSSSTLYENIARNKVLEKYNHITDLFLSEQYDQMFSQIREFEELDRAYQQENLYLPLDEFYLDFEDYQYAANRVLEYRRLIANLETKLNEMEENFINANPAELLRVNPLTRWQQNLAGGDNRLERIVNRADGYRDDIVKMLQQARGYEQGIEIELNTKALFLIAKVYDHTADVIEIQLDRFFEVSNQLVELRNYDEDEYWSIVHFINESYKVPYATYLRTESAGWYDLLVTTFVHNLDHHDSYTIAAQNRLADWGLLTEKISFYTNSEWLATRSTYTENLNRLDWSAVSIVYEKDGLKDLIGLDRTNVAPIWLMIPQEETVVADTLYTEIEPIIEDTLFMRRFRLDGEVRDAMLSFVSYGNSSIWINGNPVNLYTDSLTEENDTIYYARNVSIAANYFTNGDNIILIRSENSADNQAIVLNLDLIVKVK